MGKLIQKWLFPKILKTKTIRIGNEIIKEASSCKSILDFGCGNMLITNYIQKRLPKSRVNGVDVLNLNLTDLEPVIYDGKKLPFKNEQFELGYTVFVLHHCSNEIAVLKEFLRVCKNKAVIIEEVYDNSFEKYITFIHDYVMNRLESIYIYIPFHFHNDSEWKQIFNKLCWKVVEERRVYQMPWWFTKQKMYVLEKE